jgi:hypothetical protein
MDEKVTMMRRPIDEPGEFLDWLIERGWSLRGAALALADAGSTETQHMLRVFAHELEEAS